MLDKLRAEIDECDSLLVDILYRRFACAARIADYKRKQCLDVYQPEREALVLDKIATMADQKPYGEQIKNLYQSIFRLSRSVQLQQVCPHNIVLIGFMGSGKTSVGRWLAHITGYTFYDVDAMIEEQTGQSIAEIFHRQGERFFREREREVVEWVSKADQAIISCGGGVVLDAANVAHLKEKGKFVWLTAGAETLYERIRYKGDRPVVFNKEFADIRELLQERCQLYSRAADYEVRTDDLCVADVGQQILNKIKAMATK